MRSTENFIPGEELPTRAGLVVIQKNDPNFGLSEDEIQDRLEFIRYYLFKDFEVLMMIPKQDTANDFFIHDYTVDDTEYTAFNTHDYQRQIRPFNRYGYAMKKIMEKIKDMATIHSCISDPGIRAFEKQRYENLVDFEFRRKISDYAEKYKNSWSEARRCWLKQKIAELNRRIIESKKIWERYAPPENWDT
jgi:hypothetical protein